MTLDPAVADAKRQHETFGVPRHVYQAWRAQWHSAKRRGIAFDFTLLQWAGWWKVELAAIGPHAKRGLRRGEYMMCRIGDAGAYAPGNVYCGTAKSNAADLKARDPEALSRRMREWHASHVSHLKGKTGAKHPRSRPVLTPLGRFESLQQAGEAHGIARGLVHFRVARSRRHPGWRYADQASKRV
jgi:hypothetical protein